MTNEQATAIEAFRAKLEAVNMEDMAELNAKIPGYFQRVEIEVGKKFVRFVKIGNVDRSILLFVEIETGNIMKAASWKVPAKGIRGNIAHTIPRAGTGWLYAR